MSAARLAKWLDSLRRRGLVAPTAVALRTSRGIMVAQHECGFVGCAFEPKAACALGEPIPRGWTTIRMTDVPLKLRGLGEIEILYCPECAEYVAPKLGAVEERRAA